MFEKAQDLLQKSKPIDIKFNFLQRRHSWDNSSCQNTEFNEELLIHKKNLLKYTSTFHIWLSEIDLFRGYKTNRLSINDPLVVLGPEECSASTTANNRQACANFYKLIESPLSWGDNLNEGINNPHNFLQQQNSKHQQCMNQQQTTSSAPAQATNLTTGGCRRNSVRKLALKNSAEMYSQDLQSGIQNNTTGGVTNLPAHIFGWQATKSTIKDRMMHMCLNEQLADVYFIFDTKNSNEIGQKQKIPAHKFVLSISSPVFDAMFNKYGDNENAIQEIHLIDIEFKAFVALLKFIYTDEVSISPDSVLATLYAAKKYAVPALELLCVNFLKENLNAENAFMLLAQARLFDEHHLSELCLNIIDRETGEALQAESFLDIDHETLCVVLQRDALRISELTLFQAILKWADVTCARRNLIVSAETRRQVLGNAINSIRFSQMTPNEFSEHVALTNLLTDAEKVEVFLHFCLPQGLSQRNYLNGQLKFPVGPRMRFIGKEMSINRFQRIEASWGYSGTPDRIKFTVDAPIYILGFGLYGSVNESCSYNVFMEIINFGSNQILAKHETNFLSDGSPNIFTVMFPEPVEICSGLTYIASARLKGAETHYGTKGLRRIVRQSSSSKYGAAESITFQFSYAAGNNNGTSVDDGQIPEIIFCEKFL